MKTLIALIVLLLTTPVAFAGLSATSSVNEALDALHEVGKDLRSFTADVRLGETDLFAQETATRIGQVWYQLKTNDDARLRVTFTKREKEGLTQEQWIEYKLENGWLIDRNYSRKLEVNRQMLRPGEKLNLLKLGEGPFPLPIGQRREDVLKQFEVKKIEPTKTDPADTVHLTLTPRAGTEFESDFSTIDVWVSMQSKMPRRIETLDKNQTAIRTTDLQNVLINPELNDSHFKLPEITGPEWQRRDEAFAK